jgi:predicted O-methyltransferase YrrM
MDLAKAFDRTVADQDWKEVMGPLTELSITKEAWGVNPGDRRALFHLVCHLRPGRVLEIGTHIGASTVHLAAGLLAAHRDTAVSPRLVTVDIIDVNDPVAQPWSQFGASRSPRDLLTQIGCERMTEFVTRPSLEFLGSCGEAFDLIFLDGDHRAATVYREIPAALRVLAPGGSVLLHDFYPGLAPLYPGVDVQAGPFLAVRRLQREGAEIDVLPLGDLPWPTKCGGTATTLALLGRSTARVITGAHPR